LLAGLEKASFGWHDQNKQDKTIMILTDSGLKVSNEENLNSRARLMLLSKMVPKLKKAGIKVYAISIGNKSDEKLLKTLASQTDGKWFYVDNLELLSSVTKHIYKQMLG
jgi:hypothetical protein